MEAYEIRIEWEGPFKLKEVIENMDDGGSQENNWDGEDYGIYQIYGKHILCGENALLYIGIITERTFSQRFSEHKAWLEVDQDEEDIKICLGRVYDPKKHSAKDNWATWKRDIELAEKILIYKYSPHYNGRELAREPDLSLLENIRIIHTGSYEGNRLLKEDNAPKDFHEW